MTRDLELGVDATTYHFRRQLSHVWSRRNRWGWTDLGMTLSDGCTGGEGGRVLSFSTSRHWNWLCTGSRGTQFTCCSSQNTPLTSLASPPVPSLLRSCFPMEAPLIHPLELGVQGWGPAFPPLSSSGHQMRWGTLWHSGQACYSASRWSGGWSSHGYNPNPLSLAHPMKLKEQLLGYRLEWVGSLPFRVLQTHMSGMEQP